ncbi:unnamed protein product [Prunus brigantina]
MGNNMQTAGSDEDQVFNTYVYGEHNTPMAIWPPPPNQEVPIVAFQNDEALAIALHLEEMGDDFQNLSMEEAPRWAGNQDNVDPDGMSYEELRRLEESSGSVSKGLPKDVISRLPTHKYKPPPKKKGNSTDCAICLMEYKKGDLLIPLPCLHQYHAKCIKTWLANEKVLPNAHANDFPSSLYMKKMVGTASKSAISSPPLPPPRHQYILYHLLLYL